MTTETAIRVEYEACEDGHNWHVIEADGSVWDSCETQRQAERSAASLRKTRDAERRDERIQELQDLISEAVGAVEDLDLLERIKAMLGA